RTSSRACTRCTCRCIHFRGCCLPCGIQRSQSCIDRVQILALVSYFQFFKSAVDCSLIAFRKLVTVFLQLLFSLEYQRISLVDLFDRFLSLSICISVSLSFLFHALDFSICQARRCFDTDLLFFTGSFVLSRNM